MLRTMQRCVWYVMRTRRTLSKSCEGTMTETVELVGVEVCGCVELA